MRAKQRLKIQKFLFLNHMKAMKKIQLFSPE